MKINLRSIIKVLLKVFKGMLVLLTVLFLIRNVVDPNYHKVGGVIAGFVLPFLPEIIYLLIKVKLSMRIEFAYYLFLFFALHLGICMDFYKVVPYYDKIVHMSSGIFSAVVAHYVLIFFGARYANRHFRSVFLICFSLAIAVMWEFFEFFCDKVLGQSMQQLISVGVDDTMWDLIMAFIGAIIGGIVFISKQPLALIEPVSVELSPAKPDDMELYKNPIAKYHKKFKPKSSQKSTKKPAKKSKKSHKKRK